MKVLVLALQLLHFHMHIYTYCISIYLYIGFGNRAAAPAFPKPTCFGLVMDIENTFYAGNTFI